MRLECVGLPNMMKYPSLRTKKNDLEAFRPTQAEPKTIKRPPFPPSKSSVNSNISIKKQ